jgi:hypothetical protein
MGGPSGWDGLEARSVDGALEPKLAAGRPPKGLKAPPSVLSASESSVVNTDIKVEIARMKEKED